MIDRAVEYVMNPDNCRLAPQSNKMVRSGTFFLSLLNRIEMFERFCERNAQDGFEEKISLGTFLNLVGNDIVKVQTPQTAACGTCTHKQYYSLQDLGEIVDETIECLRVTGSLSEAELKAKYDIYKAHLGQIEEHEVHSLNKECFKGSGIGSSSEVPSHNFGYALSDPHRKAYNIGDLAFDPVDISSPESPCSVFPPECMPAKPDRAYEGGKCPICTNAKPQDPVKCVLCKRGYHVSCIVSHKGATKEDVVTPFLCSDCMNDKATDAFHCVCGKCNGRQFLIDDLKWALGLARMNDEGMAETVKSLETRLDRILIDGKKYLAHKIRDKHESAAQRHMAATLPENGALIVADFLGKLWQKVLMQKTCAQSGAVASVQGFCLRYHIPTPEQRAAHPLDGYGNPIDYDATYGVWEESDRGMLVSESHLLFCDDLQQDVENTEIGFVLLMKVRTVCVLVMSRFHLCPPSVWYLLVPTASTLNISCMCVVANIGLKEAYTAH
jgi:hypothetical protein